MLRRLVRPPVVSLPDGITSRARMWRLNSTSSGTGAPPPPPTSSSQSQNATAGQPADTFAKGAADPPVQFWGLEPLTARELYDPPPFTTALERVHWLPLPLIEEIPLPERVLTEIELIMAAWSEEQAKYFYVMTWIFRVVTFLGYSFLIWYAYRVAILTERRLRGTENMPSGLRIGNVVYLDLESHGNFVGRVVIGLLNEDCPLYCEYFHRRCTGSGGKDDSFRGVKMQSLMPNHAAMFGDGAEMTHEVPGFHPNWLPTERESEGAWRGAVSSICLDRERQTPNFIFHISAGDYTPQVFGMVLSGWDTIEKISRAGNTAGGMPKMECTISGCGELCTLDKAHITPLPWKLFESVSTGYDADKYGEKADRSLLQPPASFSSTLTKSLDHITLQSKESMGLTNGTIPL